MGVKGGDGRNSKVSRVKSSDSLFSSTEMLYCQLGGWMAVIIDRRSFSRLFRAFWWGKGRSRGLS